MNHKPLPNLSALAQSISVGSLYEHFKGQQYKIIAVARHSETLEELVVYQALYGEHGIWVRPVSLFFKEVIIDGHPHPRFKLKDD